MTCAALAARSLNITSVEVLFWEEGLCPSTPLPLIMDTPTKFLVLIVSYY